jgi:prephenate dehydratase
MGKNIKRIYTLGPEGTNCERAAKAWLKSRKINGEICLQPTLEEAVEFVKNDKEAALLSCVVYPNLHKLVFDNIKSIEFFECFVINTYPMVLATVGLEHPRTISTHPAPENLILPFKEIIYSTSNAQAALDCAAGKTDGCITTKQCAKKLNLKIIKNFGELPMGFALHVLKR